MLHRGDPGSDHLEGRIERVEVEIDPPRHEPGDEPQLERHVRRPELHRGQTDMVVGVDKSRQHHLMPAAEYGDARVLRNQFIGGSDLGDDPVMLQHRAVRNLPPIAAVGGLGDDAAGADDAGRHGLSPGYRSAGQPAVCSSPVAPLLADFGRLRAAKTHPARGFE